MTTAESYIDIKARAIRNLLVNGGEIFDAVREAKDFYFDTIKEGDHLLVENMCKKACLNSLSW